MTSQLLAAVFAQVGLEDGVGIDDMFWFAGGLLTALTLVGFVFRRPLRDFGSFIRWTKEFREDWQGEPARDGRSSTPGVMQRLSRLDGELTRNGGSTTKDKAAKALDVAEQIDKKVDLIASALLQETQAREAWDEQYRADQQSIREEWTQVFLGVAQMIHLPPEEQAKVWDSLTSRYVANDLTTPHPE